MNALWSPDGRHIAYLQGVTGHRAPPELRVATLDGKARTIYRPGSGLMLTDWLPDGSAIMIATSRPDRTWTIGLVAIADGSFTPLRTLAWDFTWRDKPRVSPDGRFVAYVERTARLGDVHVVSRDGRKAFKITDHPADDRLPIWSPDGKQLAFISNRFGTDALWTVAIEEGQAKGEAVKLKDGMNGVNLVDWSRRGLICGQTEQNWDVFTIPMDPRTARSTGAPAAVPYKRSGWNVAPAWSPDGTSLAFVSGSQSDLNSRYLVVMPTSGSAREFPIPPSTYQVLYGPSDIRWFGNGLGLGFAGSDAKGQAVVFRLSLSSGQWTTIPRQGSGIEWNDDGTAFYFVRVSSAGGSGIFRRSMEGGHEELLYALTTSGATASRLEISPDRRWLAFEQQTTAKSVDETQLIVVNLESGERRTVASLTAASSPDAETLRLSGWSPDGRVLVRHRASGFGPVKWLLVPLDGGAMQPLSVDVPASTGSAPSMYPLVKWSPDGSSIVFVQHGTSERAFILENPLADLPAARIGATRR
jgi:Tol biopolymer transport system component